LIYSEIEYVYITLFIALMKAFICNNLHRVNDYSASNEFILQFASYFMFF